MVSRQGLPGPIDRADDAVTVGAAHYRFVAKAKELRARIVRDRSRDEQLEAPPIPEELLDPWRAEPEGYMQAIRDWCKDDSLLVEEAHLFIESMIGLGSRSAGWMLVESLRLTLQRAVARPPEFASITDAVDAARGRCQEWTLGDYQWHTAQAPAVYLPLFLVELAGHLSDDTLARLVYWTWVMSGRPQEYVSQRAWRELFRRAGFTVDGSPGKAPTGGPRVMYRAAVDGSECNMSWTAHYYTAARYLGYRGAQDADRAGYLEPRRVWVCLAPAESLLAYSRLCDEWVIDTANPTRPGWSLPIRCLDDVPRSTHWPHCTTPLHNPAGRCPGCGVLADEWTGVNPFETASDAFFAVRHS